MVEAEAGATSTIDLPAELIEEATQSFNAVDEDAKGFISDSDHI